MGAKRNKTTRQLMEADCEVFLNRLCEYVGAEFHREGMEDTPARVVKSWDTIFGGYRMDPKEILKTFSTEGENYDEIVLVKNIDFYSTCEHHMLPFYGKAAVAYIPEGTEVLGLSKLPRLVECFSRRMQTQERITSQVARTLAKRVKCKGAACVIEAKHLCMMCRGVEKQESTTVTSCLIGAFFAKPEARAELFQLIRG